MKIMYRVGMLCGVTYAKARAFEVISSTEKSILFLDRDGCEKREKRKAYLQEWFDTWDETKRHLLKISIDEVESLQKKVGRLEDSITCLKRQDAPVPQGEIPLPESMDGLL